LNLNKMSDHESDIFFDTTLDDYVLINYLENNVNRPIKKEEMRENIVRLGKFKQKGNRALGLKTLNKKLEKFYYKISTKRNKNRTVGIRDKTYWVIQRI